MRKMERHELPLQNIFLPIGQCLSNVLGFVIVSSNGILHRSK
jgi:hypothetical protein